MRLGRVMILMVAEMLLATALLWGQAGDTWPLFRGTFSRQGVTASSRSDSIGPLRLNWTFPDINQLNVPINVDNVEPDLPRRGDFESSGDWNIPALANRQDDFYDDTEDTEADPYLYTFAVGANSPVIPPLSTAIWKSHNANDLADPAKSRPGYYKVEVWVPSTGTKHNGQAMPNTTTAVYTIKDSRGNTERVVFNQAGGGGWNQLSNTAFYFDGRTPIEVTLTNLLPAGSPDEADLPNVIVVADAVRFRPDYGTIQTSPAVIRNPLNPSKQLIYFANTEGTVYCLEHDLSPAGTIFATVRWAYTIPDVPAEGDARILDDGETGFSTSDLWTTGSDTNAYNGDFLSATATTDPGSVRWARWTPTLPRSGYYHVYVWFPALSNNLRKATYKIVYNDAQTGTSLETNVTIDQTTGGRWVPLTAQPLWFEGATGNTLNLGYVELTNFKTDNDPGTQVVADAIRFVPADPIPNAVYSSPVVAQMTVGGQSRWVVIFGSNNGRVYCLDALGDGVNGTPRGGTTAYWVSAPTNAGSFGYSSPVVVGNDLVVLGNSNGRMYAIDTDDGDLRWMFPEITRPTAGAFVASPAYDQSRQTLYIGSMDGHVYAVDTSGNLRWAYPFKHWEAGDDVDERPLGPITTTPAVSNNRVFFATSQDWVGTADPDTGELIETLQTVGRVYAVDAAGDPSTRRTTLIWRYPDAPAESLPPFWYSSPTVVDGFIIDPGNTSAGTYLYIGDSDGFVYALNARDSLLSGEDRLVWQSEHLGASLFSSNAFIRAQNQEDGFTSNAIAIGTNGGRLVALYATTRLNRSNRGKAFVGWNLLGPSIFSSPAVANGWLYVADDWGVVYAFYNVGYSRQDLEDLGLGEEIQEEEDIEEPEPDYENLKVFVTKSKQEFDRVMQGDLRPDQVTDVARLENIGFEWGDRLYVIFWDFEANTQNQTSAFRIQIKGPGNTTLSSQARIQVITNNDQLPPTRPENDGLALGMLTIQAYGNNFCTPGPGYVFQYSLPRRSTWWEDLNLETDTVPDSERFGFGVANPLAIRKGPIGPNVGWNLNADQNLVNGNGLGVFFNLFTLTPLVGHGQSVGDGFQVADRSKFGLTQALSVRAISTDLQWQGQIASVIEPLPWEVLPYTFPPNANPSPDYPDIPARQINAQHEGGADIFRALIRLKRPTGDENARSINPNPDAVNVDIQVPRFQPANLNGYSGTFSIYVDSNNNGRFDGNTSLVQTPVNEARFEAYREVTATLKVPADYRMAIEEPTIDFGSLPASFGYDPRAPINNPAYRPWPDPGDISLDSLFNRHAKTFSVKNLGNVNLRQLFITKAINSPQTPVRLFSDSLSPFANISAWFTIVSNLDAQFFPRPHWYGINATQPYPTLHKPRAGDYAPTHLSIPDVPYGQQVPPGYVAQYGPPQPPRIAMGIPPFQPLGTYSQWLYVYMLPHVPGVAGGTWAPLTGTPGVVAYNTLTRQFGNVVTVPATRVVVKVTETRLTGGTNTDVPPQDTLPQIDLNPTVPPTSSPSNLTPAAFRVGNDPTRANVFVYWSSNRVGSSNQLNATPSGPMYIFWSRNGWDTNRTDSNGWQSPVNGRWWMQANGPYPDPAGDPLITLFNLTPEERRTIRHEAPFAYTNPMDGQTWLFWIGSAIKEGQPRTVFFYAPINNTTGQPDTPIALIANPDDPLDSLVSKGRPIVAGLTSSDFTTGGGTWLYYTASPGGRPGVFYRTSGAALLNDWSREFKLPLPDVLRSVSEVYPIPRIVAENMLSNNPNRRYFMDVVMSATADRNVGELFMVRYPVRPGDRLLVDPRSGRARAVPFSRVNDETLRKEPDQNGWRARHLDWVPVPAAINIEVDGRRVNFDGQLDEGTGLITYNYVERGEQKGRIVVDPVRGLVRFPDQAPRLNQAVTASYTPRLLRLSDPSIAGSYSQVVSFLQKTANPRHNAAQPNQSLVRKGQPQLHTVLQPNERMPVDRLWVLYRRGGSQAGSGAVSYYKTLRMGVQLNSTIAVRQDGILPLQQGANDLAQGANHVVIGEPANQTLNPTLGYYEVDWARGRIYFTEQDEGKLVEVKYYTTDTRGNLVPVTERHTIRWIEEGSISGGQPRFETPLPLPKDELYLWAMPNVEFSSTNYAQYGVFDEAVFLFWNSTRHGVPDLYAATLQPRFYIDVADQDAD